MTPEEALAVLERACERLPLVFESLWSKVEDDPPADVFLERVTDEELRLYWAIIKAGQR